MGKKISPNSLTRTHLEIRDTIQEMWEHHHENSHDTYLGAYETKDMSTGYVYGVERTIERFAAEFGLVLVQDDKNGHWEFENG